MAKYQNPEATSVGYLFAGGHETIITSCPNWERLVDLQCLQIELELEPIEVITAETLIDSGYVGVLVQYNQVVVPIVPITAAY